MGSGRDRGTNWLPALSLHPPKAIWSCLLSFFLRFFLSYYSPKRTRYEYPLATPHSPGDRGGKFWMRSSGVRCLCRSGHPSPPNVRRHFALAALSHAVIVIFLRLYLSPPSPADSNSNSNNNSNNNNNYNNSLFAVACGFCFYHVGITLELLWCYIAETDGQVWAKSKHVFYGHGALTLLFLIGFVIHSQRRDPIKKTK